MFVCTLSNSKHYSGSLYVELNEFNGDILIVVSSSIPTEAELQIVTSQLRKLLAEPWKVWRITACMLKSITILAIPKWVVRVENKRPPRRTIQRWLAVVVRAYKSRRRCSTTTWTNECLSLIFIYSSCICPDVLSWTGSMSYTNPINITTINGAVTMANKCIWWSKLVTPHSPTHLLVLNSISNEYDWVTAIVSAPSTQSYRVCVWQI